MFQIFLSNLFDSLSNILKSRHGHLLLKKSPIYEIFNDFKLGKVFSFSLFTARNHLYEVPHFIGEKLSSERRNNSFKVTQPWGQIYSIAFSSHVCCDGQSGKCTLFSL